MDQRLVTTGHASCFHFVKTKSKALSWKPKENQKFLNLVKRL